MPKMSLAYEMLCSRAPALICAIHSRRTTRFLSFRPMYAFCSPFSTARIASEKQFFRLPKKPLASRMIVSRRLPMVSLAGRRQTEPSELRAASGLSGGRELGELKRMYAGQFLQATSYDASSPSVPPSVPPSLTVSPPMPR
jgi:hypothetical protein